MTSTKQLLEYVWMDLEGNFYIIHPYENILKRNIIGNIIR